MEENNFKKSLENNIDKAIYNKDFSNISQNIKESLDTFIDKKLNPVSSKKPVKDPKICKQNSPEKLKAHTYKRVSFGLLTTAAFGTISLIGAFSLEDLMYMVLFGISGLYLLKKSKFLERISHNFERFKKELGPNTFIHIKDLASAVGQNEDKTIKDLLYMINKGYFKQGRIVEDDSLFILDIPTFDLYKESKMGLAPSKAIYRDDDKSYNNAQMDKIKERAKKIITASKASIGSIDLCISRIENRAFLEKVIEVKKSIQNITNIIKRYPEKAYILNKFIEYFLPTTVKLIEAYTEYEMMGSDDKEILSSLKEIDETLVIINAAFEKICLELLEDRNMDIKADIDTMKLLFKQEGYMGEDFNKED